MSTFLKLSYFFIILIVLIEVIYIKKLFLIPFLLILCLCSCKQEYNILDYQNNNIEANCTVNDKYNINITKNEGALRLEVLSPKNLEGVQFEIRGNEACAIKDEIKIPIKADSLKGICALLNCFSLSEEAITTVSVDNVISFDTDYGLYTITYGENNLPQKIAIASDNYEYSIIVNTIKLAPSSQ